MRLADMWQDARQARLYPGGITFVRLTGISGARLDVHCSSVPGVSRRIASLQTERLSVGPHGVPNTDCGSIRGATFREVMVGMRRGGC